MKPCAAPPIQQCGWYTAAEVEVKVVAARTAGGGLGFPATYFLSTVLWALRELMYGEGDSPLTGLCATSRNILWSTTKVNEACARPRHVM